MNECDKELYTGFLSLSSLINGPDMDAACLDLDGCFKVFAAGGCRDSILGRIPITNGAACGSVSNCNGI